MSNDKNELEKHIFDPKHPQKCKSYKLLLNIIKKENATFFSSEFLQYFYKNQILTSAFDEQIWDKPDNYNELDFSDKTKLYVKQLSQSDLNDFQKTIDPNTINMHFLDKYSFLKELYAYQAKHPYTFLVPIEKENFNPYIIEYVFRTDDINFPIKSSNINKNFILFSKNDFNILKYTIEKASIFITLEENVDKFVELNKFENIKPLFLKKIEDVDLLLNVLEKDLKKELTKDFPIEEISTIKTATIQNFFSINEIHLDNLQDKKEIYIVGENGDGKTLLLQALAVGLKGIDEGVVFDLMKSQETCHIEIKDAKAILYDGKKNNYQNLFAYGANRNNNCQMKEDEKGYLTLFDASFDLKHPIEWLKYVDHSEKSGKEHIVSVIQAKELLQKLLNSEIEIEINPDKVTFREKGSEVNFEQLSAGYKGIITIIADLLIRLSENQPYVKNTTDFKAIVMIDEVELHLHPKWKYGFVAKLREIFPQIQFIMTTHSPTVLLGASKEAVFYKIYKEDGEVCISNQLPNEGYTNNSLVSSPLFELESITSRDYNKKVSSDDYLYEKIHQVISQKIKEESLSDEAKILELIEEELAKL
jgi:predicted ATPase